MKGAAILLICALTLAKGERILNKNGCPVEGTTDALFPHENCNQFYQCDRGVLVSRDCPQNLLYNPTIQQCDWPENVNCEIREVPDTDNNNGGNGDPSEAPAICAAEGSDGVLVAHENCNSFYNCFNGQPVEFTCYEGLVYNLATEYCDWPENVNCGNRILPDGEGGNGGGGDNGSGDNNNNCDNIINNPAEAPEICAADGSDDRLVAHENCNQFYICSGGSSVALKCPESLLYNPNTQQCDYPNEVNCCKRIVPDGGGDNGEGGNNGENGNGDNGNGDNNGGGNDNPSEAPKICAAEDSNDVLVAHEKCNKFYVCGERRPYALTCPPGLLFNPSINQCDWPENVECGDRIIPDAETDNGNGDNGDGDSSDSDNGDGNNSDSDSGDGNNNGGGNDNPSEAPKICAAEDSNGVLVAHEKCNKFYVCGEGIPYALTCPPGLLFNPSINQCDWPENVKCGDRIIPDAETDNGNGDNGDGDSSDSDNDDSNNSDSDSGDGNNNGGGNDNPSEAPKICAAEDSNGVLVAHEKCNKFYVCGEGIPYALTCPPGLLFNPIKDQCDWQETVECGDRIIPDGDGDNGGGGDSGSGDNNNNCDNIINNPAEAPEICAADGSDDRLVAHENCNQFYICSGGSSVALKCPGNLLYNPTTQQCDYPNKVNCCDRIVPDGGGDNGDGGDNETGGDSGEGEDNGEGGNGDNGNGDNNNGGGNDNPSEAPKICAAEDSNGVLVAHEKCNKFYVCGVGIPYARECPPGLLFNPRIDQCDWPENVECGDRIIPDAETDNGNGDNGDGDSSDSDNDDSNNSDSDSGDGNNNGGGNDNPSEAPKICAAEDSNGVLVAHEKCNKFYVCGEGIPYALTCPPGLLFNPIKDQCDWQETVECGDRIIPDGDGDNGGGGDSGSGDNNNNCDNIINNPAEAPEICAADGSDDRLVAHENCNQFYICSGGSSVALKCPGNLLYNPTTQQCDYPNKVNCCDRIVPDGGGDNGDGGDNETGGDSGEGEDNGEGGNGDNGNGDNNNGGGNDNPSEAPKICAAEDSNGVLVAHEKCNKFYVCGVGIPYARECPPGLLFNPRIDQCDWPENVECGDRIIPDAETDNGNGDNGDGDSSDSDNDDSNNSDSDSGDGNNNGGGNDNPSEAPKICAAEDSNGVLVAHEKCNKFYVCGEGIPYALTCPPGLLFNPIKDQCDWQETVECGDRIIPDGDGDNGGGGDSGSGDNNNNCDNIINNPAEAPEICAADGSDDRLVAHENCNQFYICSGGSSVALKCPGNLLYNPTTQQCDYPNKVNCCDRIVPDGGGDNGDGGDNETGGDSGEGEDNGEGGNGDNGNGDNNNGGGNDNPSEAPKICAAEDSNGVLVAHEKCNKFYVCGVGIPYARECPPGLLFNPRIDQCDWPENVKCGDRIIPDSETDNGNGDNGDGDSNDSDNGDGNNSDGDSGDGDNNSGDNDDPSKAPVICALAGSDGVLVAHEMCNQFYVCLQGEPLVLRCAENLLYTPITKQCDWPENVDCGNRAIPVGFTVSMNKHWEKRRLLLR